MTLLMELQDLIAIHFGNNVKKFGWNLLVKVLAGENRIEINDTWFKRICFRGGVFEEILSSIFKKRCWGEVKILFGGTTRYFLSSLVQTNFN